MFKKEFYKLRTEKWVEGAYITDIQCNSLDRQPRNMFVCIFIK